MAPAENFNPSGRDVWPLLNELHKHGGNLSFNEWVNQPASMVVTLHLPEDPDKAAACRAAIEEWRSAGPH